MKLLTLLRHAKSSWDNPGMADYDRPLNDRGRRDAPFVGQFFQQVGLTPDLIVSSPARRARQTCDLFAQEAGYNTRIRWEEDIYAASSDALLAVVRSLRDDAGHVLMVGHNPGFEDLAAAGARPQFMLWASTGTKNPAYSDLLYVEPLIGAETVNTLPDATLDALIDHGTVAATLTDGLADATAHYAALAALGIDMDAVGESLQVAGLGQFEEAFAKLLAVTA